MYVNDLPQVTQNSAVTQYADDTTMTLVAEMELEEEQESTVPAWYTNASQDKPLLVSVGE